MRCALLLVCAVSCAHAPPAPTGPAVPLALDGTVVLAKPDPLTRLETFSPDELFHVAREMETANRWKDARTVYHQLLANFPESGWATPARFNLGLAYEQDHEWVGAAEQYRVIASAEQPEDETERRTWLDAHYRLAVCYGKLEDWWRTVAVFDHVLELEWLGDPDRLEALVGRGIAMDEAGDGPGAEIAFAASMRFYREAEARGPMPRMGLVAEAAFRMGDIARERYEKTALEFPVELLRTRLEEKCEQLLSAQSRYLQAIRYGDAHTVAAAGFRIGALYETLYDTVVSLSPPAELTPEQIDVYNEEVRRKIGVLLEKAIKVYEKALLAGRRAPTAHDWVARLELAVERVRSLYLAQPVPPVQDVASGVPPSPPPRL
jgi:tetratricopeptide (TPR) repeat protein